MDEEGVVIRTSQPCTQFIALVDPLPSSITFLRRQTRITSRPSAGRIQMADPSESINKLKNAYAIEALWKERVIKIRG